MVSVCMFGDTKPIFNEESSGAYLRACLREQVSSRRDTLRALTMISLFSYTISMIKQLKNHGLLDWDFVSTLSVILILISVSEVIN